MMARKDISPFFSSFLLGAGCKIFFMLIATAFIIFKAMSDGSGVESLSVEGLKKAYPNGIANYSFGKYLSALIVAPLIENLQFPLALWMKNKTGIKVYFLGIVIGAVAFFAHYSVGGGMAAGITGAVLFLFMAAQYFLSLERENPKRSYWLTVATHCGFNAASFSIIHFLDAVILYA